jgi:subtilisin-like proprotein convertase family protein
VLAFVALVLAFFSNERAANGQGVNIPIAGPEQFTPTLYNQIMISFSNGVDVNAFAQRHGMTIERRFAGDSNAYLFNTTTVNRAAQLASQLQNEVGVVSAFQNHSTGYVQFSFVPNDPLFNNPAAPNNFGGQWHLGNNLSLPTNVNVASAWANNITGAGVMIGIVDDGIESDHADFIGNFSAANTFDFINNNAVQNLGNSSHGTMVAGVAAARGGNGIGVTGVAPFAGVSSQRVFSTSGAGSAAMFANATTFNSVGADPSIHIKNHSYGYSQNYVNDAAQVNAINISTAAGTIHVVSAGNSRGFSSGFDSNKKMLQNSANVITVAGITSQGRFANYSNFGANIFVTAPSGGSPIGAIVPGLGITTTDRTGDLGYNYNFANDYTDRAYTSIGGGTSAASPLVAGILALGKQANPRMDTRLAKHILARTSSIVDAVDVTVSSDGGWRTNAAGFSFNQNYGFGLIHASNFVDMVSQHEVSPLVVTSSGTLIVGEAIPDDNLTGISRTVENSVGGFAEEVLVNLNITHSRFGDLEAFLTSPSGYSSRLMIRESTGFTFGINWTFLSNAFWGEQTLGTWDLRVTDVFPGSVSGNVGTWNSFEVTWRTGTIHAVPEPSSAFFCLMGLAMMTPRRRYRRSGSATPA